MSVTDVVMESKLEPIDLPERPENLPPAFHLMAKPIGPICNLDCSYCFYLKKEKYWPERHSWRMSDEILEQYVKQYIEAHQVNEVNFAWQGGEPTLMGVDFFRRAVELQRKYARPGMNISNAFQTNGTLLDDEWGEFLHENNFLIGISIDGPPKMHDQYRLDKGGKPTSGQVIAGLRMLQKHKVEHNILCVVNRTNSEHPKEVYNYFKELGAEFMQFIPIVEMVGDMGEEGDNLTTSRSVRPEQYGRFLCGIFDEWVVQDIGRIFVQIFDIALEAWMGYIPSLCIFNETCGDAMIIEHNGDIYSCDHYVFPDYRLGNIMEEPLGEMVASPFQRKFGTDKKNKLPKQCQECDVRFVCNGGCPKNRFRTTADGEPGLNYLCAGYMRFFRHIDYPMRLMAQALRQRQPANVIMPIMQQRRAQQMEQDERTVGRNAPCPCGSGKKYKQCCLKKMG